MPAPDCSASVRPFPAVPTNSADLDEWLARVFDYADNEAVCAMEWYLSNSQRKKRGSWITRYLAVLCGGLAGLVPILGALWPEAYRFPLAPAEYALLTSLLLGIAALLVAFDRFGDFSSGWIRYIRTAFEIRAALQEFRLNWAGYCSQITRPATPAAVPDAIELALTFLVRVEGLVGRETGEWATEFQRNLTQMETDARARWESRERELETHTSAAQRGTLQLIVSNAAKADDRTLTVRLRPAEGVGPSIEDRLVGGQTWVRGGLSPVMHIVTVGAAIAGRAVEESRPILIRGNQIAELTLALPE